MSLIELLPDGYAAELSSMTDSQRQAIETDKKRWFKVRKMTLSMRPPEIRRWLDNLDNADYRSDMARRLNQMRSEAK